MLIFYNVPVMCGVCGVRWWGFLLSHEHPGVLRGFMYIKTTLWVCKGDHDVKKPEKYIVTYILLLFLEIWPQIGKSWYRLQHCDGEQGAHQRKTMNCEEKV
jgi:hypothetical protein